MNKYYVIESDFSDDYPERYRYRSLLSGAVGIWTNEDEAHKQGEAHADLIQRFLSVLSRIAGPVAA